MKRALIILLVPIVAHAYEYNTEGNSPEAAYAAYIGVVTVEQAPPPPPMFYFNESTFRSYEPSWGFSNCFHTFSWGIGEPDMICSPEAFGGF